MNEEKKVNMEEIQLRRTKNKGPGDSFMEEVNMSLSMRGSKNLRTSLLSFFQICAILNETKSN